GLARGDLLSSDPFLEVYLCPPTTTNNNSSSLNNRKYDDSLPSFVTGVQWATLNPTWDAVWNLQNVPERSELVILVKDKNKMMVDTDLGVASMILGQKLQGSPPEHSLDVYRSASRKQGQVIIEITARQSSCDPSSGPTSSGPARYSRHTSYAAGVLTRDRKNEFYTYRVRLYHLQEIFGSDPRFYQPYNRDYDAARRIFADSLEGLNIRNALHSQHSYLYRHGRNTEYGALETGAQFAELVHRARLSQWRKMRQRQQGQLSPLFSSGGRSRRSSIQQPTSNQQQQQYGEGYIENGSTSPIEVPEPSAPGKIRTLHDLRTVVFTYSIVPRGLYFSETGAAFFQDFMSKHAMHANRAPEVMYSGEFRLFVEDCIGCGDDGSDNESAGENEGQPERRPQWTLLIDNNSGTYGPKKENLYQVKKLFEQNFPDLIVKAVDREDPYLTAIKEEAKRMEEEMAIVSMLKTGMGLGPRPKSPLFAHTEMGSQEKLEQYSGPGYESNRSTEGKMLA
ncbi:hypothetical protein BGW38_008484, partial [Lunasporangiospora selenospora]